MASQNAWIAISIGVFVAGIAIGFGIFASQMNTFDQMGPGGMMSGAQMQQMMKDPQFRETMMQDPEFRNDYANQMMQDPQHMDQMMEDPEFRNEMVELMVRDTDHMNRWMMEDPRHIDIMVQEMQRNHDFMMGMAMPMIEDPDLRMQVMGHMTENPDAMEQMQRMMGGGMMDSEMMQEMMEDPETRTEMIEIMSQHVADMQELMSSELSEEEFDDKMIELMEKHQESMMELMHGESMHDDDHGHDDDHDDLTMGMPAPSQTHEVSIVEGSAVPGCEENNECYLPYSLQIWVGDVVSWKNLDSAAHTVTSGVPPSPDGKFDSGMMLVNQSWEFTFDEHGEYDYYCVLHPWMTGKVIVNEVEEMVVNSDHSDEEMMHDESVE